MLLRNRTSEYKDSVSSNTVHECDNLNIRMRSFPLSLNSKLLTKDFITNPKFGFLIPFFTWLGLNLSWVWVHRSKHDSEDNVDPFCNVQMDRESTK